MSTLPKVIQADVTLWFPRRYVAHPYWPEREILINLQKGSGVNLARTDEKRAQRLAEHLKRKGISMEEYHALEEAANREWYTAANGEICIPAHQLYGCLIEATNHLSASQRPCPPESFRHFLGLSDLWHTGKQCADGVFVRLVQPKNGSGQPLSNQRSLRQNAYIADFLATGILRWHEGDIHRPEELPDFVAWAGQRVGVGACRKMAYGRFQVSAFAIRSEP